jgi:S1-C subfamily serine protease
MAVGTADGYEGSVAIGTALNLLDTEILITNNISSGNSGGPLIDNEGNVVGVVTWSSSREQYNGAKSLDAMCAVIIPCEGKTFWTWE